MIIENARLQHALIIPTGAPIAVGNDAIECCQSLQIKQLMIYLNSQMKQYIY